MQRDVLIAELEHAVARDGEDAAEGDVGQRQLGPGTGEPDSPRIRPRGLPCTRTRPVITRAPFWHRARPRRHPLRHSPISATCASSVPELTTIRRTRAWRWRCPNRPCERSGERDARGRGIAVDSVIDRRYARRRHADLVGAESWPDNNDSSDTAAWIPCCGYEFATAWIVERDVCARTNGTGQIGIDTADRCACHTAGVAEVDRRGRAGALRQPRKPRRAARRPRALR